MSWSGFGSDRVRLTSVVVGRLRNMSMIAEWVVGPLFPGNVVQRFLGLAT